MKDDDGKAETVDHDGVEAGVHEGAQETPQVGLQVVEHGVGGELEGVGEGAHEEQTQGVDETGALLLDAVEDGGRVGAAGVEAAEDGGGLAGGGGEEGGVERGVRQRHDFGGAV